MMIDRPVTGGMFLLFLFLCECVLSIDGCKDGFVKVLIAFCDDGFEVCYECGCLWG